MRGINYYYNNSYKLKKIASYKKILSKRYGIPFTETDSINTCIIDTENANGADTFEEANLLHQGRRAGSSDFYKPERNARYSDHFLYRFSPIYML